MANIKSAKKRVLVNQTKALRNKMIKSGVKTAVKKVDAAIAAGDKEAAKAALLSATSIIDKATFPNGCLPQEHFFMKDRKNDSCC